MGVKMASLRSALQRLGVDADVGLRRALPVRPPGLRELIRVATLPRPRLDDVEPDDPEAFESFEVEDPQGIVHGGGDRWFLSSQHAVRRCTIEGDDPFRPAGVRHEDSRNLLELLQEAGLGPDGPLPLPLDFDHIGDLGFSDPIVYLPLRRTDEQRPNLIMGLSADLRVVGWAELELSTGESTCAVNPWNGLLYVPGRDDTGWLQAYDVAAFSERFGRPSQWGRRLEVARADEADIQLLTPQGGNDGEGLQGLAFSANGRIYVTRSGAEPYINRIFVYDALTGRRFGAERVWDFSGDGDEIEGIAVHPSGVLYVGVNDNDAEFPPFSQDDFDLYTFRFRTLDSSEV
jgi:hypothetical protein